ncbi:MAG TPA: MBL fold metallo-hydrolase [Candidatus Nanoarchaeia archaeon]|nr:MBL fold metallo-hydrolase [Candidatus Nanoarchaeia archaeon]
MRFQDIDIAFLGHSGFLITTDKGKRIAIDPYEVSSNLGKVDILLITHSHYDHCSFPAIQSLAKPETIIIATADSQSKIAKLEKADMQIIESGDEFDFEDLKIEAVPAYNLEKPHHPKKEGGVGFVIKIGKQIIYHAGDTDNIPEMQKLTGYSKHDNHFLILLPVSGETVMDVEQAVEVADMLKPDLAVPMHYGAGVVGNIEQAKKFVEMCVEKGIRAEVMDKI